MYRYALDGEVGVPGRGLLEVGRCVRPSQPGWPYSGNPAVKERKKENKERKRDRHQSQKSKKLVLQLKRLFFFKEKQVQEVGKRLQFK